MQSKFRNCSQESVHWRSVKVGPWNLQLITVGGNLHNLGFKNFKFCYVLGQDHPFIPELEERA